MGKPRQKSREAAALSAFLPASVSVSTDLPDLPEVSAGLQLFAFLRPVLDRCLCHEAVCLPAACSVSHYFGRSGCLSGFLPDLCIYAVTAGGGSMIRQKFSEKTESGKKRRHADERHRLFFRAADQFIRRDLK